MHSVEELRRALDAERAISHEQALIPGLMQHDLSNIISRVSLSVSAMSLAQDEAERARWMREVEGGLSMAGQMLDGMRTMFVSGAAVPDLAEDDFGAFVRELIEQPGVWEAAPVLEIETPAALRVVFSPSLMRHAVMNLVRNALTYAERTWVRVRLAHVRGDLWQVTIANGGPGIPGNHRKYILEPCSIAKLAPQNQTPALGLYIARLCLRRQGIALRVRANARATVFAFAVRTVAAA